MYSVHFGCLVGIYMQAIRTDLLLKYVCLDFRLSCFFSFYFTPTHLIPFSSCASHSAGTTPSIILAGFHFFPATPYCFTLVSLSYCFTVCPFLFLLAFHLHFFPLCSFLFLYLCASLLIFVFLPLYLSVSLSFYPSIKLYIYVPRSFPSIIILSPLPTLHHFYSPFLYYSTFLFLYILQSLIFPTSPLPYFHILRTP